MTNPHSCQSDLSIPLSFRAKKIVRLRTIFTVEEPAVVPEGARPHMATHD
jgi:hypothetical protein